MNEDLTRLRRWLRRAQPPRAQLARALFTGFVASATNLALLVGAIALLVDSATRPGLRAVAMVLVVIELFAFLRSPLRFSERLAAHRLGFAAVTRWRRWLVLVIGQLNYSTWRSYASGDLLERALGDTDELQDLWLRFVIPFLDLIAVMIASDIVVAALPPHGRWWTYAVNLVILQLIGVGGLSFLARRELAADRELRHARGIYRAQLVELSAATPEITLLGRASYAESRAAGPTVRLRAAERGLRDQRRLSNVLVIVVSLLALVGVINHPATSSVWLVVAATIGLTNFELLSGIRSSLHAAVEVSGGGERLEALATTAQSRSMPWPGEATLRVEHLALNEDERVLVRDATLAVAPGDRLAIVGDSGVGKSTLLRALARLDPATSGTITLGGLDIDAISEDEFRRHVAYVASEPGLTRGYAVDVVLFGRSTERDPFSDLGALGLTADRTTRFEELSRGERGRVAIARALVTDPAIIVLDEPTAGLGQNETARLLSLLSETGATVIVATHDELVANWCDAVVELRAGDLVPLTR